ncbi:2214_t:CDS:2, partial [Acaulospora colombiana]
GLAVVAAAAALPLAAGDEGTSGAKDKERFALSTGAAPEYVFARLGSGGEPEEEPEEAAERLEVALTFATGLEGRLKIVAGGWDMGTWLDFAKR